MTKEEYIEATKIVDKIEAVNSVLRRLETSVNTDLQVIVAAVGTARLTQLLNDYKESLNNQLEEL